VGFQQRPLDLQGDFRGGRGDPRASPTNTKAPHYVDVRLVFLNPFEPSG